MIKFRDLLRAIETLSTILIESRGLKIGYGAATTISCPDFSVGVGDFLCIVGPNGTGKSTLVKTLAGLIPPLAGEIAASADTKDGGIGYMPQRSPLQDDFPATVREVVLTGCQSLRGFRPFYSRAEKNMAERAIIRFGLKDIAKRPYRSLSGGQRQRVLLARALCVPRRLLLLDEPTAGLDQDAVASLYSLLDSMCKEGLAIAMVTHENAPVRKLASHVLRLGEEAAFTVAERSGGEVRNVR